MIYHGYRTGTGSAVVFVEDKGKRLPLSPRLKLANHSPTGFEWGYGGSGPAQLALALLAHALGDGERALRLHQRFKWRVTAQLDRDQPWSLTDSQVRRIAHELETERPPPRAA